MSPTAASLTISWTEDSSHPVALRPFDGRQFDGVAGGDAEPARGNLGQADLAVAQALPEPLTHVCRLIESLAVPIARCDADDLSRQRP